MAKAEEPRMSDKAPGITQRKPDCVTEVRKGNTVLTVFGYFKLDATETDADKMARVIASSANLGENDIQPSTDDIDS